MLEIPKNQTLVPLELDTYYDLSTMSVKRILYTKPSGATGFWNVTVENGSVMVKEFSTGDLDELGIWEVQTYVENAAGKKTWGKEIVQINVIETL